ncbi:MAG: tetratricopeptide repeat protein [Candidatus Eremiobacteraeota bacterium]|nr:tetratricopeptide repeat protein [Candidatus Eremiobacteraeota bacterium]
MKRLVLIALMALTFAAATVGSMPAAHAGIFGGKASASPSPSPSPSALPTASPEPADVAIPRLQAKLKTNPNDQQSMVELAGQFLGINRPDLALQLSQHLLQMGDKTSQVYYIDGYSWQQAGRLQNAIVDFEQAENLDPSNIGILEALSTLYLRTNRAADAERIGKRAVSLNKDQAQAYSILGAVYASEGKFDDARSQFEHAATLNAKDTSPLYQIATTYGQQNNIPMAVQTVDRVLAIDPKNVQALVFKADLYAKQHDDRKAPAAYDDAVVAATTDDQRVAIMVRKATYFVEEKKPNDAQGVFDQAVAQFPKIAAAHVAYGDFWASQKNLPKAQQEWQAGLALDKNNGEALLRMAQVSMSNNRMTDAVGYLKTLTQITPDAQGFAMLGQAYSFLHDYRSAKDACGKSFQIDRQPATLGCVAGADFELKNYKEASQIFDALDRGVHGYLEQNPQLLYVAAKSYEQTNQKPKALSAYKRLLAEMRKGTSEYAKIQRSIASLSKKP